jgi:hypothetical protein
MGQIAPLFGLLSASTVSDVVYRWANPLDDALSVSFPTPTRSQRFRAYPAHNIRVLGDARVFMELDLTEAKTQAMPNSEAHASLHSDYKSSDTVKFLVGCDPIGATWSRAMPAPFPSSISDPVATAVSIILASIPFGLQMEVGTGFLIENICILLGIGCIRPPKKLKGQTLQSAEDTALTQKIGNTRIVIEKVNGGAKGHGRYINGFIPVLQLGLAPLLMRVCFFMQNFRAEYIQGYRHDPDTDA